MRGFSSIRGNLGVGSFRLCIQHSSGNLHSDLLAGDTSPS